MYARLDSSENTYKASRSPVGAYLAVVLVSIFITMIVMAGVEGEAAIPSEPSRYAAWTVFSGAFGGAVALYAGRGWLGLPGALGFTRAVVGSFAVALIGASIAGALILPIYGAFYAPIMMMTEFVERPVIAALWLAVLLAAHYMLMPRSELTAAQKRAAGLSDSELSPLTQAQFYSRK
jgi:hypothetical protein